MLISARVEAQSLPLGQWWHNSRIIRYLNLKNSEIQQLDQLFKSSRRNLIDLKNEVKKKRFQLDVLLDSGKISDKAVKKQFKRLERARSQLSSERLQFMMEVRKIIGPQRFQQLKSSFRRFQ